MPLSEMTDFFLNEKEKAFRAKQVWEWLWKKSATSFDDMSNLSKSLREKLKNEFGKMQTVLQETINTRNSLQNEYSKLKEEMGKFSGNRQYTAKELSDLNNKLSNVVTHEELHSQISDITVKSEKTKEDLQRNKELGRKKNEELSRVAEKIAAINARKVALDEVLSRDRQNLQNAIEQQKQIEDDKERTRLATNRDLIERIKVTAKTLGLKPYSAQEVRDLLKL